MSYSFQTAGATKDEAKANVSDELDKVIAQQPIHNKDATIAEATAGALIDAVRDPKETEAVLVNVVGSCYGSGNYDDPEMQLDGASLNVSVSFRPR